VTSLDRLLTLADSLGMVVVLRKYSSVTANACGGVSIWSGYTVTLQPDTNTARRELLATLIQAPDLGDKLEAGAARLIEKVVHLAAASVQKEEVR